jgi:hypothetical protein
VPLAVYYGTIAAGYSGDKLFFLILSASFRNARPLFGMSVRIWKLSGYWEDLERGPEDSASVKLELPFLSRHRDFVIVLRWVLGLLCNYLIMQWWVGITFTETIPVFFILLLCIPINSVISYCTTEHLLSPVLMDERMRGVQLPRNSYTLFSVSFRTTAIVVSVLIIPLVTLDTSCSCPGSERSA